MEKEALESFLSKIEFWQVVCACLVAIGVGGEFVLGWMYFQKTRALHRIQHVEDLKGQETIETLRNKNLELQKLIKEPRTIDLKRAEEILDWGSKGAVNAIGVTNDEGLKLGQELAAILATHGWTVPAAVDTVASAPPIPPGITLAMNGAFEGIAQTPPVLKEPAATLYKLLTEAVKGNVEIEVRADPRVPKDTLTVWIGPKY